MSENTQAGLGDSATMPTLANAAALKPPITVQQWGELDGWPRYDLVNGVLKEIPDVAFWHELLLIELVRFLNEYVHNHHPILRDAELGVLSSLHHAILAFVARREDFDDERRHALADQMVECFRNKEDIRFAPAKCGDFQLGL